MISMLFITKEYVTQTKDPQWTKDNILSYMGPPPIIVVEQTEDPW